MPKAKKQPARQKLIRKPKLTSVFTIQNIKTSWSEVQEKLRYAPFRDVVDYRDYHLYIDQKAKRLRHDILKIKYRPAPSYRVRSQRSKGMNRVLTYFHPADLTTYNLLCKVVHELTMKYYHSNAFFSRARHPKPTSSVIKIEGDFLKEPYGGTFQQWKRFSKHRAQLGEKGKSKLVVVTDISNFFEMIHHETVRDTVFPFVKDPEFVNLLLLFLEHQILRPKYTARLHLGIPQDSFDCSRVLANLILLKLDRYLEQQVGGNWNRWMDDVTFCVKTKEETHVILQGLSELLREDGLTLNSGKTKIFEKKKLKSELLVVENKELDQILEAIKQNKIKHAVRSLRHLWTKHRKDRKSLYWEKVTKRIFQIAGQLGVKFLISETRDLLIDHPGLHTAICGYFESLPYHPRIFKTLYEYLNSDFALYEEVRVRLLECLINIPLKKRERQQTLSISWKIFKSNKFEDQHYSRALAVMNLYAYGNRATLETLCKAYAGSMSENFSEVTRRYMAAALLASPYKSHRDSVLKTVTHETSEHLKDILLFALHTERSATLDPKTKASFRPTKFGFGNSHIIEIRKLILFGILAYNQNSELKKQFSDILKAEVSKLGVQSPRRDRRIDEIAFDFQNRSFG